VRQSVQFAFNLAVEQVEKLALPTVTGIQVVVELRAVVESRWSGLEL